ncbi:hypothetical protein AALT_g2639 [Alternaria alternata]|nr:hypothetical protein AALT_g2639 [Alternaria alternata]
MYKSLAGWDKVATSLFDESTVSPVQTRAVFIASEGTGGHAEGEDKSEAAIEPHPFGGKQQRQIRLRTFDALDSFQKGL